MRCRMKPGTKQVTQAEQELRWTLFPTLHLHTGGRQLGEIPPWVPASPEKRSTPHDRFQILEIQRHTDVPDVEAIWNTQGHWLTCLNITGGRYRIFQQDLKSLKKILRCPIVFKEAYTFGRDVYPGLNWLKKAPKKENCTHWPDWHRRRGHSYLILALTRSHDMWFLEQRTDKLVEWPGQEPKSLIANSARVQTV